MNGLYWWQWKVEQERYNSSGSWLASQPLWLPLGRLAIFLFVLCLYRFEQFNFFAGDIDRPPCIPELSVFKSPNICLPGTKPYFF